MTDRTTPPRTWRLLGVHVPVGAPEEELRERAYRRLGVDAEEVLGFRIARRALDARGRGRGRELRYVVHVDLVLEEARRPRLQRLVRSGELVAAPVPASVEQDGVHASLAGVRDEEPVVVVGTGPAGFFAAWVLARNGLPVTVLERGAPIERRSSDVVRFHRTRVPNGESNLLFGEGGAGTYSDGKLYTRVNDALEVPLLELLVECGAPEDILYDSRAHIGTDKLHRMLPRMRARLEELGVRFQFDTRLEELVLFAGTPARVRAVRTDRGELACRALILAVGHSARDTWGRLAEQGVPFEAKPFQLGVRVEHPQELINEGRFGEREHARLLGAASYELVSRAAPDAPSVHSFCMCPGGRIVASVNEAGFLCTNGMSNSTHSSRWANAAVVTTLGPREFGPGCFDGVEYQRRLEALFFEAGGADYSAPAQRVPDFLEGRRTAAPGLSSFRFGTRPARIDDLLPPDVTRALRRGLHDFDRRLPGFAGPEGLLVGVETRSSGPVRIPRDRETYRARGFANLLPVGEGAGYAGGIMSAAIDGARAARALVLLGIAG